jgi:hypothetical protein
LVFCSRRERQREKPAAGRLLARDDSNEEAENIRGRR